MRIIAGRFRSRTLRSPKGRVCRPAMGRTREALFSMLEARGVVWSATTVLDIFAGSGSLSFEALSRGAVACYLLENDPEIGRCIAENARTLCVESQIHIWLGDAIKTLRTGAFLCADVVFLDPPYRKGYAAQVLACLPGKWLSDRALLAVEIEKDLALTYPDCYALETERLFGQTKVVLLRYVPGD